MEQIQAYIYFVWFDSLHSLYDLMVSFARGKTAGGWLCVGGGGAVGGGRSMLIGEESLKIRQEKAEILDNCE